VVWGVNFKKLVPKNQKHNEVGKEGILGKNTGKKKAI